MRGLSSIDDDKLRILMTIVSRMAFNAAVWTNDSESGVFTKCRDVHSKDDNRKLKKGMLVACMSSGIHDWTVSFVEEVLDNGSYGPDVMLREIGTNRLCRMGNESYYSIHGLGEDVLYEGARRRFYHLVVKTLGKLGDDWRRYGGLEFIDDKMCRVLIREKWGGPVGFDSVPFGIEVRWDRKRLSMKRLIQELDAGGYRTREFERKPRPPTGSETRMQIGHIGVLVENATDH